MLETKQAQLPSVPSNRTLLERMVKAQKLNVSPPRIVTENSVVDANNNPTKPALRELDDVAIRSIQNSDNTPVFVGVGFVPTAELYHFVLAAASSAHAGDGGFKDFSNVKGAIYIFAADGTPIVATFEALAPEAEISNTPQVLPFPE